MLTRRASSPLHGAADRSSSYITYICISKDCFIRNADVLAFHCAISAFKELPKNHISQKRKQPHRTTGDALSVSGQ